MSSYKKKYLYIYLIFFIFIIFFYLIINKYQNEKKIASEPISINLLTSVHPNLTWNFESVKKNILVKPGEVVTIEYHVENIGNIDSTGIATFAYFPNQFSNYINKINCFCYDAQTLKPSEKNKFILVLMIDPMVTKDSKTKDIKEATLQFTFFDYKEYKKSKQKG